jgi:flagellin
MMINTNISAVASAKHLKASQAGLDKSLARLSSGSKITEASDDAAGSAVSMLANAQVKRFQSAKSNVGNALSFSKAQDGYLKKMGSALERMSELALLALDHTKTDADRELYNLEYAQLAKTVLDTTQQNLNGIRLFSSNSLSIPMDSEGGIFNLSGIDLTDIPVHIGGHVSSLAAAQSALDNMKDSIAIIASSRAIVGSNETRLYSTLEQISVTSENLAVKSSRIRDVDVAEEASEFARFNILVQSGTSMLAQANQSPQNVLTLLQ